MRITIPTFFAAGLIVMAGDKRLLSALSSFSDALCFLNDGACFI